MSNTNTDPQAISRKWLLILLVVILATVGTFFPPLLSTWVFGFKTPLVILSGTEFVSLLSISVSAYFGANIWEKHLVRLGTNPVSSGVSGDIVQDESEDDSNKEA